MKIQFYGAFPTYAEAVAHVAKIIGGGIIQEQDGQWCVFGVNPD